MVIGVLPFYLFTFLPLSAQPSWVKKASKSVVMVKTFTADGTLLGSACGFYVTNDGVVLSSFATFKGAQRAVVIDWVNFLKDYLDGAKWEKLHTMVEAIPVDHHMLHGDYHTKNVMMQNGEVLLIDMDTLAQGNPVFEFASIYNAFVGFYDFDHDSSVDFQGLDYDTCITIWKMLPLYFGTTDPAALKAVEDKAAIIGYARLMRRLIRRHGFDTEEGKKLIAHYKNQIETRIDSVDTLMF